MKLVLLRKAVLSLFLVSFLMPVLVEAITFPNPLNATTFEEIVNNIINFIFYVAIVIFPIMVIVASFFFLSSGGDPTKVKTAKNILLYSVIGLMIVLLAKGIISVLESVLGGS